MQPADVSCKEDGSMTPHNIKVARLQFPSEVSARQSGVGTEFSFAPGAVESFYYAAMSRWIAWWSLVWSEQSPKLPV